MALRRTQSPLGGTQKPGGHRTYSPTSPLRENCFVEVTLTWLHSIFPPCQSPEVRNKPTVLTLPECQSSDAVGRTAQVPRAPISAFSCAHTQVWVYCTQSGDTAGRSSRTGLAISPAWEDLTLSTRTGMERLVRGGSLWSLYHGWSQAPFNPAVPPV